MVQLTVQQHATFERFWLRFILLWVKVRFVQNHALLRFLLMSLNRVSTLGLPGDLFCCPIAPCLLGILGGFLRIVGPPLRLIDLYRTRKRAASREAARRLTAVYALHLARYSS